MKNSTLLYHEKCLDFRVALHYSYRLWAFSDRELLLQKNGNIKKLFVNGKLV